MPAHESLSGLQFNYELKETGGSKGAHHISASLGDQPVGSMTWRSREIQGISVEPEHRRQGVATALWNEGQRLASENAQIPAPKHAADRTNAGDAWARSVGGRLPRRIKL